MLILEAQQQEEAQQYGQKRISGLIKKQLSPEKEVVNPWALCDVEK